jgi:hypothetical protein
MFAIRQAKGKKSEDGTGGVAQVVEHLPSKCKALLSSNSSMEKKKKKWGSGGTGTGSSSEAG